MLKKCIKKLFKKKEPNNFDEKSWIDKRVAREVLNLLKISLQSDNLKLRYRGWLGNYYVLLSPSSNYNIKVSSNLSLAEEVKEYNSKKDSFLIALNDLPSFSVSEEYKLEYWNIFKQLIDEESIKSKELDSINKRKELELKRNFIREFCQYL